MQATEYQWKSYDGLHLYALKWTTIESPVAVVAFVHGHGDHCRRYDEWFSKLTGRNIAVLAFDYRGQGRSQGRRGVIAHFDDLLKDVTILHEMAKELFPGIPVVLYGHSLGATIVLSYILNSKILPELAIATSPWLQLKKPPGMLLSAFIKAGNLVAPFFTFKTGLRAADFSSSECPSGESEKDDLIHNRMSPRLFLEVEKEAQWILTHYTEIGTPLLLMQGGDDLIMDCSATRNLSYDSSGYIYYHEWEHAGHQLHNSERNSEVMDFIIDWVKEEI